MKNLLASLLLFAVAAPALAQATPGPILPPEDVARPGSGVQGAVLRGLVFLGSPDQLAEQGVALASLKGLAVDASRVPLLDVPGFADDISGRGLLGAPLDEQTLAGLRRAVFDWLQRRGQGASVLVPAQDASSGVVQVVVMQPRLGALRVEGANVFPASTYLASVRARPGEPLDTLALDEDLAWIQRANPFRSAVAVAAPGRQPGETDITLQVSEQRPWKVGLWADNSGTANTQRERLGASITTGNFLGLGHLASYHLATSPDWRSFVGHTLVYSLPLPWRDKLNFVGNYARVHADVPQPLVSSGQSGGLAVRYDRYLRALPGWTHAASLALDYKSSDNNLLFSSMPVFDNRTAILQLVGGYEGSGADDWGRTQLRLGVTVSPGDTVSGNDDKAFAGSRAGAKARYVYATAAVVRTADLPAGWRWSADLRLQWSGTNLLGSEQLPAMGISGVRGFPEAGLFADRGVVWRNELGPGAFALGERANAQLFAILDAASVGSARPQPGEQRHFRFAALGLGARVSGPGWQAQLEAGKPVSINWQGPRSGWRAHARVSWEY